LVWRGLLTEKNRQLTVTPEGERALTQVREAAKRWIEALESQDQVESETGDNFALQ
jgi:DNA-binding transcriptional LysR family regulator